VLDTQPSLEELADMQRLDISALESEVNDS
jgi:hypothetical protein